MIKTSCRNCIFAIARVDVPKCYDDVDIDDLKEHNLDQEGCMLGKLEQFKAIGTEIEKVDGFYEIKDRICMFCRNGEWAKGKDRTQILKDVEEESKLRHSYVVIYNEKDSINALFETLEDVLYQTREPLEVFVINNSHRYKESSKIFDFTQSVFKKTEVSFYVQTIFNKFNDVYHYDNDYLMTLYLSKIKGNWFTVLEVPQKIRKDFTDSLHNLINIKLEKFVALLPSKGLSGSTFQTFTVKILGGNLPDLHVEGGALLNLIEKLEYANKHQFKEIMTRNLEKTCPIS